MNANAREWNVSAPHPERVAQIRVYWRELAVTRYRKSNCRVDTPACGLGVTQEKVELSDPSILRKNT